MQAIDSGTFHQQAYAAGVGYDPRYPAAKSLIVLPTNDHRRFWCRPEQPCRWPHFISSLLKAAGANETVLVYPRSGIWPDAASAVGDLGRTQLMLLTALGITPGWAGAIAFDKSERDKLVAILTVQFLEPIHDLYVLPLGATTLLQFDHHDVVHVSCATESGMATVIDAMSAARFELPDDLPDGTFKQPKWMRESGEDS